MAVTNNDDKNLCRRMYADFTELEITALETALITASTREEKAFLRTLLNLKLQLKQEKIIGAKLL